MFGQTFRSLSLGNALAIVCLLLSGGTSLAQQPSLDELARHAAFLEAIKDPIWNRL